MKKTNKSNKTINNVEKLKQEIIELKNGWQRTQADFENFRNRTQKEKNELIKFANEELIYNILPVLDNFDIALKHKPKELADNDYLKGLEFIKIQLEQVLNKYSFEKLNINIGDEFDHNTAEAVKSIESKKFKNNQIIEIIQSGYKLADKVIRPAKVVVAK